MPPDLSTQFRRASRRLTTDDDLDIRRARGEISCAECRRLKLKCDKKIPCSSCTRRGCPSACPNGSLSSGQGTRHVLSDTAHLHKKIEQMGNRIRQLEDALAIFQSGISNETHPLLQESLLTIKSAPQNGTADSESQEPRNETSETINALGVLTIGDSGTKYYGPSAGTEALFNAGAEMDMLAVENDDTPRVPLEIMRLSKFPFPFGVSENPGATLETILNHLPSQARAWSLYETYIEHASWMYRPLKREEMIDDILSPIYKAMKEKQISGSSAVRSISPHKLAVLFLIFAHGALVDLTQESYNAEYELYYHLSCACLSLRSIFTSPEMATVQAVLLMGSCHAWGGRKDAMDTAWTLLSLGSKLAQSIGLHRDGTRFNMDAKTTERRRGLFWELFSYELFFSLGLGRPPSIRLSYIDCEFPEDDEATLDENGKHLVGFYRWKFGFMKEILSQVTELTLTAKAPQYKDVLELDRKVREKTLPAHLNSFLGSEPCSPSVYMRKCLVSHYRAATLMFIHRSFFAQAILDHPTNPLRSAYSPSFLAAYRSASSVIKASIYHFERFPDLCYRMWTIWTILFPSAIIVSSIVTRCPSSSMAPSAFIELGIVCDLFERGAKHSRRARNGLAILRKLKVKAHQVYSQYQTGDPASKQFLPVEKFEDGEDELALFGGQTRVLVSKLLSGQPRTGGQSKLSSSRLSASSEVVGDSTHASPEGVPDVHPALMEYLSVFPSKYVANSPDISQSVVFTSQDVIPSPTPQQSRLTTQENQDMPFSWPPPPSSFTTGPNYSTTPQTSSFEASYMSFVPPLDFGTTTTTTTMPSPEGNIFDLGMMVGSDSGMDEQWMSFMRETGLLDGSLNDAGLYGMPSA